MGNKTKFEVAESFYKLHARGYDACRRQGKNAQKSPKFSTLLAKKK